MRVIQIQSQQLVRYTFFSLAACEINIFSVHGDKVESSLVELLQQRKLKVGDAIPERDRSLKHLA